MREIKFRAFFKVDGRIYEVLNIDFANKEAALWDKETAVNFEASFDEIELMQYTGRNDVNGVEIYDGYLVKFYSGEGQKPIKGIVEFDNNSCFYVCEVGDYIYPFMTTFGFEVLGNIYENPNLEIK